MLKSKFSILSYLSVVVSYCNAQNLVPNPYFDTTTIICNAGISSCEPYDYVQYAEGWSSFGGTPDYFNSCYDDQEYDVAGVPKNELGYQNAVSGNAYCGLIAWPYLRELIGARLITPLIKGNKYTAVVMASRADSCSYAADNLGISFSLNPYTYVCVNAGNETNHAMVYDTSVITATGVWTTISGSFVADSDYVYVIVGNFFSDSLTDTIFEGNAIFDQAYYYIGYVSVVPDTTTEIDNIAGDNNITLYPNPGTGKFSISANEKISTVQVFDMGGRLAFSQNVQGNYAKIDASGLAGGVYNVRAVMDGGIVNKKLVVEK